VAEAQDEVSIIIQPLTVLIEQAAADDCQSDDLTPDFAGRREPITAAAAATLCPGD
jgi:hypothetical protein